MHVNKKSQTPLKFDLSPIFVKLQCVVVLVVKCSYSGTDVAESRSGVAILPQGEQPIQS